MKNINKSSSSDGKQTKIFHLSGEKLLLGFFASLSLAFALFYTFDQNRIFAISNEDTQTSAILPTEKNVFLDNSSNVPESSATVSDVVAKALAFKALLTTTQQATLEKTYTASLARKWSNLPCGSGCRNGIQFSTLTSAQLTAALAVIQAAEGTTANEGSDEFNQIRLADDYLAANGGGGSYGSGIYFISFLNTPTTSGAWMLQFGGHHYAANIAYNNGHVVATTPHFYGVEPVSFTLNGATYAPLMTEHDNMANMLASLSTTQLATAKLSQTFSDVTLSPGETNGGSGTFPTTKVGLAVSTLSSAQQLLVLEAMKPWVKDMDDTVAANLLAIYQSELSGTYIAYTGNGTSGDASSFLTTNTNYARIDGPTVWIEFIVQTGAVFRNSIHYHSIWRDHVRDYGQDLSLTTALDNTGTTTASKTKFDFDGDGKADISVFRPSGGNWYVSGSTSGFTANQFGASTDTLVPADYDGDGKTDLAVYRSGTWYLNRSTSGFYGISFGAADDIPVPADYDGDGKADIAVFRPSNGVWYIQQSTNGFASIQFGQSGDKPVAADYDGDGKADVAVNRSGNWYIQRSSAGFYAFSFGDSNDKLAPADYDGDGKADIAVFRPSNGTWYLQQSTAGFLSIQFGISTDIPVSADYDGDGKADVAVFRSGTWYLNQTTSGFLGVAFGTSTDAAVPTAFVR